MAAVIAASIYTLNKNIFCILIGYIETVLMAQKNIPKTWKFPNS